MLLEVSMPPTICSLGRTWVIKPILKSLEMPLIGNEVSAIPPEDENKGGKF